MNDRARHLYRALKVSTALFGFGLLMTVATSIFAGETGDVSDHDWKAEFEDTFGPTADVELGNLSFVIEADCEDVIGKYGSCFGNNPASPYGVYEFGDFSESADSFRFRLAENQAAIFIGRTPPIGRYFSFQLYPFSRDVDYLRDPPPDPDGVFFCDESNATGCPSPRQTLLGRMGLNLNHLEVFTDGGDDNSFDQFTVVVTTANQEVEDRIRALLPDRLVELGLSPGVINIDPVPCPHEGDDETCDDSDPRNRLVLGSEPEADDFILTLRIAMTESLASQHDYLQAPSASVLRVTFSDLVDSFSPYTWAEVPPTPGPRLYNELDYEEALEWLAETIRDEYLPGGQIGSFDTGGGDYYNCL